MVSVLVSWAFAAGLDQRLREIEQDLFKIGLYTMNLAYTQSALGIGEILDQLARRAHAERLECALPLIETLQRCFSPERTAPGVPVGVLTVQVWLELLDRWEETLKTIQRRRISFLRDFFRESVTILRLEHAHISAPASLVQALQELLTMIDGFLAMETGKRQANQAA